MAKLIIATNVSDIPEISHGVGWIASGMRYFYRMIYRKKTPFWYLAVYEKQ
jgi:hypothetical protein